MLKEIFKENKLRISLTYAITITEYIIFSLLPYNMGLAIDDLLAGNIKMLIIHSSILLFSIVIGAFRRAYDTRVFSDIYINKASKTIKLLRGKQFDDKKLVSRYGLVGIYSDFFEYTLPLAVRILIGTGIAFLMVAYIEYKIMYFVGPSIIAVLIIQYYSSKKIQAYEYTMQNTRENISESLVDKKDCDPHLETQKETLIRKSDIDCISFVCTDTLWGSTEIACIVIVCNLGLSMGEITSVLMYLNNIWGYLGMSCSLFYQVRLLQMTNNLLDFEEEKK